MVSQSTSNQLPDPHWKDLHRIGGSVSLLMAFSVLLAIGAYFIWPYMDDAISMQTIFTTLQTDRLGGLISLDLFMLLIAPMNILTYLALYVVLKQVNELYSLIALFLAVIAVVLVIQCRPLVELATLSDKYAIATDTASKAQFLAAGESLRSLMNGTAWTAQTIFFMVAGLIDCLLMLRTHLFSRATAWTGILSSIIGMGFFLPVIGLLLLFVNTIGGVIWCILLSRDFFWMDKNVRVQL